MDRSFIGFHFGLVQDVAVLRPLVRLAALNSATSIHLLVSAEFVGLDSTGRWMGEVDRLGSEIAVKPVIFEDAFDVLRLVGSGRGMIVAGSESDAKAHRKAHQLFQSMPGRIRTIALQHGFECVGFLHNARHDATTGRNVRFAADVNVAWFERESLHAVSVREQNKIYVAGPPLLIDPPTRASHSQQAQKGLICENLHSVRFASAGLRSDFLATFTEFARRLASIGETLVLRPHPAGQFTQRKGITLPPNVELSEAPLYDINLSSFAYIISAPSTILFDFALAGVPAATWIDTDGKVDASNFEGLPQVATVDDWWRFHWAAKRQREALVRKQDEFVARLSVPSNVPDRYRALLALA